MIYSRGSHVNEGGKALFGHFRHSGPYFHTGAVQKMQPVTGTVPFSGGVLMDSPFLDVFGVVL